jgi:magnesium transporter
LFQRLGYYFISFRALGNRGAVEAIHRDRDQPFGLDAGGLEEANIYLVVFREGICSFHFTDVTEHIDRVRSRILLLEDMMNTSSDWIAHGILDSVIDSFFPLLKQIEREVMDIEDLVLMDGNNHHNKREELDETDPQESSGSDTLFTSEKGEREKGGSSPGLPDIYSEKELFPTSRNKKTKKLRFNLPSLPELPTLPMPSLTLPSLSFPSLTTWDFRSTFYSLQPPTRLLRRLIPFRLTYSSSRSTYTTTTLESPIHDVQTMSPRYMTLIRMARTRRLVTTLTRLLASKSEVVTAIRKRLVTAGKEVGLAGLGKKGDDNFEVAMYMGDVQDHILTLQMSLTHCERTLSQSHPTYLSQLRTTAAITKSGSDKAILILSFVSMAVLCVQALIGLFSMNVNVPHNVRDPSGKYNVFGAVLALSLVDLCVYTLVVRAWWAQAKRRRQANRL